VSVSPDRSAANPIEGTELSGEVWVFVGAGVDVTRWEIDDRPADLDDAPLDADELSPGVHRIEVVVEGENGPVTEVATFEVVR
jgi:hypothetical protein